MSKKQKSRMWIIVGVLLILWGLLLFRINEPFFAHHEAGEVWIASAIRTFNQFGPQATNFLPIRTPGPTTPETGEYYLHHPPLIVWFSAIATHLFGYYSDTLAPYELSIRMVAVIATILTIPLFYVLTQRLSSARIALIAVFLYVFTPVTLYFGRMPYYDMLMMPMVLAFACVFMRWMNDYSHRRTGILIALGILTMWTAWAGIFYFAAFGLIALIYGKREQRIGILVIGLIVCIATVAIPVLYALLNTETMQQLRDILALRTSNQTTVSSESETFTAMQFIGRYLTHMITMLSIASTLLGAIGIGLVLARKKTLSNAMILGFFAAPLIFMLIVRNSWYFHDWYKIHFLPAFTMGAAIVIVGAWAMKPEGIKRYAKPFIVAILVSSLGASAYWTITLHETTNNDFFRKVAAEIPQYTEEDDLITSSVPFPFSQIEYYAYRNIAWGVAIDNVVQYYDERDTVDFYYLLCLSSSDEVADYDGVLSEFPYDVVADECRLIHLVKA